MTANGRSIEVSGLLPFTEYTVAISAFTNNTKLLTGPPCYIEAKTAVGGIVESAWCCTCTILVTEQPCALCLIVPPAPRKPQIVLNGTRTENTVVLNLPPLNETNGPIRLIVLLSHWHLCCLTSF